MVQSKRARETPLAEVTAWGDLPDSIYQPERDTRQHMERFTPLLLEEADEFAETIRLNRTFTHFQHTPPRDMLDRDWTCWLLFEGERVIGWAQVQSFPDNPRKQHVARIGFALLEEWRGQGLGSFMVDYVMKAIESKYKKLVASVYADNTAMLSIYLKRGFIVEGFFENEEEWDGQGRNVLSLAFHRR